MAASSPIRMGGQLKLNDPVRVERESQQLEGIVAYLGEVAFAEGKDWVGVQLTGTSAGHGKNDGSVQGKRYFDCNNNCGVFVRKSHVVKRTLSRLEELRLRRELAKGGAVTSSTRSSGFGKQTPPRTASKTLSSSSSTPPPKTGATKARLEEIRKRREALAGAGETSSATKKSTSPSTTVARAGKTSPQKKDEHTERLQEQVSSLETKIEELKEEVQKAQQVNDSLRDSLSNAENEAYEARAEALAAKETAEATMAKDEVVGGNKLSPAGKLADANEALRAARDEISQLKSEQDEMKDRLSSSEQRVKSLQSDLAHEQDYRKADSAELTEAKSVASALEHELKALNEQANVRGAADASHYKEKAKLQAELCRMKRRVHDLESDKQEMEANVEELTLDKEQLQEEKEALADRIEEFKIDVETAQMEVEELRLELEDAKTKEEGSRDAATVLSMVSGGETGAAADAEDVAQALSVQNARLREALIRLREQSSLEKIEMARELRAAEKDAMLGKELSEQVDSFQQARSKLEEEINDLKDMVEQGSAFESMVEDLSDRIMALEDDNVALQSTIREMEEAADITAEMEEVQADENKALMRDIEERDSVIRNLEEAIRMQRRREQDFQRTVSNYRISVDTLKQEKSALLALNEGDEGEKSQMMASSQKALAKAAQLVADTAINRKRDAEASMDNIEAQVQRHLASRLESLVPQAVVGSELASMKGELLISTVEGKASRSLDGIASVFSRRIRTGVNETLSDNQSGPATDVAITLTDEASQKIINMFHQSRFSLVIVDVSSEMLRLLIAGQWPGLLDSEASGELGSLVGHSIIGLDVSLGDILKKLKEDGELSPHQTDLASFESTTSRSLQELTTSIEADTNINLPSDWAPPGWHLFKDVTVAKFLCLGAAAAVASTIGSEDGGPAPTSLLTKLDQISSEASKACDRLSSLDVKDDKLVRELSTSASTWKSSSLKLFEMLETSFTTGESVEVAEVAKCNACADESLIAILQFAAAVRAAKLYNDELTAFHPLSPETDDAWDAVSALSRAVQGIDGDEEDVNYLVRSRTIEHRLDEAIANEPKLSLALAKVTSLEKSLSSRSKEIAMQNARLSELEKLLAKTASAPSPSKQSIQKASTEELNTVREENRVLAEAMDVLQRQADEYEQEIRFYKEAKSPVKTSSRRAARRSVSSVADYSVDGRGRFDLMQPAGEGVSLANAAAIESAFFRPALQSARHETAFWKSKALGSAMSELLPLDVPGNSSYPNQSVEEEKQPENDYSHQAALCLSSLSTARSNYRRVQASMSIVDLCKVPPGKSRGLLRQEKATEEKALRRLAESVSLASKWLGKSQLQSPLFCGGSEEFGQRIGRISVSNSEISGTIPLAVKSRDLNRMHSLVFH